jgi:hypothetical protein
VWGVRAAPRYATMVVMLSLLVGVATAGTPLPLRWFGAATAYTGGPASLIGSASVSVGGPGGQCLGVLLDAYHIYSTTVGLVVSTVTFSTQRYAFGCAQLDAVTVATTSTVTQETTTTETQTVTTGTTATVTQTKTTVSSTTTVLQVQVQEGVYALLIALLLGSMVPLLARTAVKAQRIYRERRVLRAAEGSTGDLMQRLDAEPYRKRRRALR